MEIDIFSYVNEEDKSETTNMYYPFIDNMSEFFPELDTGFWILEEYFLIFLCAIYNEMAIHTTDF